MRIHRNLHNARHGGPQWVHTVKGRVAQYLEEVYLTSVTTRIQPAGQAKCQASGVRSVCAFFDGEEVQPVTFTTGVVRRAGGWRRISYDPRKDSSFFADGQKLYPSLNAEPWNTADAVKLLRDGSSWVLNPQWVS